MSTVEKSIRLYAWKTNYQTFQVVQGESDSRTFNIQLFSTTIPVNLTACEVMFFAIKPDSTKVYVECEVVDVENGLARVTLTEQMCVVDGTVDCWVQVIGDGGTDLRFEGMNIEVSPCSMTASIMSTDDMRAFLQMGAKLASLQQNLNTQKSRIDTMASLPEGSTRGDAELADLRIPAQGFTVPEGANAGTAVRAQFSALKEDLANLGLKNRLNGHSWSILGDSISHDNLYVSTQYWDCISDRVGGMNIFNYGVLSQRIKDFVTRYNKMNYSDIITVFGGVNDWGQSNPTPLGDENDNDTNTFCGALNLLCNGLQISFPKSLIIFITPIGNNGFNNFAVGQNSLGLTINDYSDTIKKICNKYKIPVVDACNEIGFTPDNELHRDIYFHDGLHLNVLGHEALSYLIENEISKHYIPTIKTVGNKYYSINTNLQNCTIENNKVTILENSSYNTTIIPNDNHIIGTVTIMMGNVDVTNTSYSDGIINIQNVNGNITISVKCVYSGEPVHSYNREIYNSITEISNNGSPSSTSSYIIGEELPLGNLIGFKGYSSDVGANKKHYFGIVEFDTEENVYKCIESQLITLNPDTYFAYLFKPITINKSGCYAFITSSSSGIKYVLEDGKNIMDCRNITTVGTSSSVTKNWSNLKLQLSVLMNV